MTREEEAREYMRCMDYTQKGTRCTRRYVYGRYDGGRRHVLCQVHARQAGWMTWW